MNELWQIVLNHHLYILVPAAVGVWLWNRGSQPRQQNRTLAHPRPQGGAAAQAGRARALLWPRLARQQAPEPAARLQSELAEVQAQREVLARQLAAAEAPRGGFQQGGGRPSAPADTPLRSAGPREGERSEAPWKP